MEELHASKLLAGALAAISGAVVTSLFGVTGTLVGAGVMSIFMAVATTIYARSLASAHDRMRRTLIRRAGGDNPRVPAIQWRRIALAAVIVFAVAMGAITTVEAIARRPLASLLGHQPKRGASTSVGLVVTQAGKSSARTPRTPRTSVTSLPTIAPAGIPTTTAPGGASTTTAPTTVPPATAPASSSPDTAPPTSR